MIKKRKNSSKFLDALESIVQASPNAESGPKTKEDRDAILKLHTRKSDWQPEVCKASAQVRFSMEGKANGRAGG